MTIVQRLEQLEKRNKRLTVALTMAATGGKDGRFDTVRARHIFVRNDAGSGVVILGAGYRGNGQVYTQSAKGKDLVVLSSTVNGKGTVTTYQPNGKELVDLTSNDNGGGVVVYNKTGELIADMSADDYGNGVVWAGNRKGKGRTLKPGP